MAFAITLLRTLLLFVLTACAEIFGCYAAWLWLRKHDSAFWLIPGALSLALFAWLLTLHPSDDAGRVYAAYGGVYVVTALGWLFIVEGRAPKLLDLVGALLCLAGMGVIMFAPRG